MLSSSVLGDSGHIGQHDEGLCGGDHDHSAGSLESETSSVSTPEESEIATELSGGSDKSIQAGAEKEMNYITLPEGLNESIAEYELESAAQMLKKDASDISYYAPVYDAQERPVYLWAEFSQGGYIIMLRTHSVPMEYSYTAQSGPFSNLHDRQKYFLGMLCYGYMEEGKVINAANGEVISAEVLEASMQINNTVLQEVTTDFAERYQLIEGNSEMRSQTEMPQTEIELQSSLSAVIADNYFSSQVPFANNTEGDCGPTAAGMLMRYYESHGYPGLVSVPEEHIDNDWRDLLKDYSSTGNTEGTYALDEADKMNAYLGTERPDSGLQAKWALINLVEPAAQIDAGKPVVIYGRLTLAGTPMNHAVLTFGYDNTPGYLSYKIHTGWHQEGYVPGSGCSSARTVVNENNVEKLVCEGGQRADTYLSGYLIGSVLWMEPISSGHVHDFRLENINVRGHQEKCLDCELTKKQGTHVFASSIAPNGGHQKTCSVCNYVQLCTMGITPASCTSAQRCNECGEIFAPALNHNYVGGSCATPAICTRCQASTPGTHSYEPATCLSPKRCTVCGVTDGPLGKHEYKAATCQVPQTCRFCQATTGTIDDHTWGDTYSEASHPHAYYHVCSVCKVKVNTGGYATKAHGTGAYNSGTCPSCGSHSYVGTSCTSSGECACGATTPAWGHNYSGATCTVKATCTRCNAIGSALGHSWGTTWSEASHPHAYYHVCSRCSTRENTGGYATKSHGSGASGSGTCPSCGSHSYSAGDCKTLRKCSCGATNGYGSHNYSAGTCKTLRRCSICGATNGYGSHNFVKQGSITKCTYCGQSTQ